MADDDVTQAPGTDTLATDTADTQTQDTQATDTQAGADGDDTLAGGDAGGEREVKPDWPDDWRAKMAGDDEKALKQLERYRSPVEMAKALRAAQQKISSGEMKATLPENATDEQIAEYRKANGIPEKPEGYLDNLPDGLVIGEADKELVNSYIERVHGRNADPSVVAETLDWYYKTQEDQIAAQAEADTQAKQKFDDELRAEWGNEYRGNINAINAFLDQAPAAEDGTSLKELILGSRLSDGTPMGNHPAMLRWLARLASDANPAGFVSPGSGMSQIDSVNDEIAEIEKVMRTDRKAYDKDEKMRARLRQLYEAQEKLGAK